MNAVTQTPESEVVHTYWPDAPAIINETTARILDEVRKSGVTVLVAEGENASYPNGEAITCTGYFVSVPEPTLAFSVGKSWEDAFPVLVHETRHFRQWYENAKVWTDLDVTENFDACDLVDRWIAGEDFDDELVKRSFKAVRAVELDCEKRVAAFIKEHNLPIDLVEYAQKSNAYVLFYHFAEKHRHWRSETDPAPYRFKPIWVIAPTVFGDSEVCPPDLMKAYEATYLQKRVTLKIKF